MCVEVVVKDLPYRVVTGKHQHWEATEWCKEKFGPRWEAIGNRQGKWCVFWRGRENFSQYEWNFEHEEDAVLFSLRWS